MAPILYKNGKLMGINQHDALGDLRDTDEGLDGPADELAHWKLDETKNALDYSIIGAESGKDLVREGYDIIEANVPGRWLEHKVRKPDDGSFVTERVEGVHLRIKRHG